MAQSYKVIAIGGGPGGIATAVECREFGMAEKDILILEKGAHPIEAIRKFYPDKKMTLANYKGLPTETQGTLKTFPDLTKAQTIDYFDEIIKKYAIDIRVNAEAVKVTSRGSRVQVIVGREAIEADIVVIGIGILGRPNKPDYKLPNSLRDHLLFDLTSQEIKQKKVLVVGGGDTSSEYCQVLLEDQNELTLVCRSENLDRMMESNQKAVHDMEAKGKLRYWKSTEISEILDEGGLPKVHFKNQSHDAEIFDKVIFALGGSTPVNFLKTAQIHCEGTQPVYTESGKTNVDRIYLVGDLVCGKTGGSIITAYNSAFRAVKDFYTRLK